MRFPVSLFARSSALLLLGVALLPVASAAPAASAADHGDGSSCEGDEEEERLRRDARRAGERVVVHALCVEAATHAGGVPHPSDGCTSTAHALASHKWRTPYSALVDARGSGLDSGKVVAAMAAAASAWDAVAAADVFGSMKAGGDGSRAGTRDGVSQIGFRSLGSDGAVARATTWFRSDGSAFESDVVFNTRYDFSTVGAAGRADLQSVATHEIGHALGLNHPSTTSANACLTMYYSTPLGSTRGRTLGVGDVLGIQKKYGASAPPAPFSASFAPKAGNEWWVEVKVDASRPLAGVSARVDGGGPVPLALRSWGAWAKSFHVPKGSIVTFVATASDGASATSGKYVWPSATPAGFAATITKHASNAWWVEVKVAANAPLAGVEARVNGGPPVALAATKWGTWAKSFHVPAGSTIVFTAVSSSGERASTSPMPWP